MLRAHPAEQLLRNELLTGTAYGKGGGEFCKYWSEKAVEFRAVSPAKGAGPNR